MTKKPTPSTAGFLLATFAFMSAVPATAQVVSPLIYEDPEYIWQDNRDPESPRPSPNAITGLQIGSTRVMLTYGRPSANGRAIYDKLVPLGNHWRTGANEATTITLTGDMLIEGQALPAGTYGLFTIPRADRWTLIFSSNHNQWGSSSYSDNDDVLRVDVEARESEHQESFEIRFEELDAADFSASVVLHWGALSASFKITEPG